MKPETEDVEWLSPDQLREWRALMALLMTLPTAMDLQLKRDAGMNAYEYQLMAALSDAPDRAMKFSELARSAQGSLSRLSHAIGRLERAGWVQRCTADAPGHRSVAKLTAAGMARMEEVAPGHVREARRLVIDALTPEQLEALGEAARAIVAAADRQVFDTLTCQQHADAFDEAESAAAR